MKKNPAGAEINMWKNLMNDSGKIRREAEKLDSSNWLKPVILLALYSGLRLREIVMLEIESVDLLKGEIRVKNKDGRSIRIVPMFGPVKEVITDWLKSRGEAPCNDRLFPGLSANKIHYAFYRLNSKIGVTFRFYNLRRAFATDLAQHAVPVRSICHLLGYRDPFPFLN